MPFWEGIKYGLLLSILIGPVFFALIQTSITRGFRQAILVAIGISLSDAVYIFLTSTLTGQIQRLPILKPILGGVGVVLLIAIGIGMILGAKKSTKPGTRKYKPTFNRGIYQVFRGFLLNAAHPGVLMFWLALTSFITLEYNFSTAQLWELYLTMIATVFLMDIFKSITAKFLSRFVTDSLLMWINRLMGLVMIGFGLHLLWQLLFTEKFMTIL